MSDDEYVPRYSDDEDVPVIPRPVQTKSTTSPQLVPTFSQEGVRNYGYRASRPRMSNRASRAYTNSTRPSQGLFLNDDADNVVFQFNGENTSLLDANKEGEATFADLMVKDDSSKKFSFLHHQLVENLKKIGVVKMRAIQNAMMTAMFGRSRHGPEATADIVATAQTGKGKTIAYLVPVIQKFLEFAKSREEKAKENLGNAGDIDAKRIMKRAPFALIFVHSKECGKTVYNALSSLIMGLDIKITMIIGESDYLTDPNFDIGVCTVGRFSNHFGPKAMQKAVKVDCSKLRYLIVDEADTLATKFEFTDMLDALITFYKNRKDPNVRKFRILAFSATINTNMIDLANPEKRFFIKVGDETELPSTIKEVFWPVRYNSFSRVFGQKNPVFDPLPAEKNRVLHPFDTLLKALHPQTGTKFDGEPICKKQILIFCKRYNVADYIALRLRLCNFKAVAVHKMSEKKDEDLLKFQQGDINIMVVTQLFARGVDMKIDVVINYDLPLDAADYPHRCGRTGRNGNKGLVITFIDFNDPLNYDGFVIEQIAKRFSKRGDRVPWLLKSRVNAIQRSEKLMLAEGNDFFFE